MDALNLSSLPPGFGFHPEDAELITYYLKNKILGKQIEYEVIPLVDIYKHEPWDLPAQCNVPTRKPKWHFFSYGDRKYPKGTRKKRATRAGYWKSTGKDRGIKHQNRNVGTKKTLVFHEGRPPSGRRTEWIMHEYYVNDREVTPEMKDSYVLCRVTFRGNWDPLHGFELTAPDSVHAQSKSVETEEGTFRVIWDPVHGFELNAPDSVGAQSKLVETDEGISAWIEELSNPAFTGSPVGIALNSVDTVENSSILQANQEAVDSVRTPETCEDPEHLFPVEEYKNILESENQNTDLFKDFDIDTDIFMDQQDDIFSFMENYEFEQSNLYSIEEETGIELQSDLCSNEEATGIERRQREEEPSSFNTPAIGTTRIRLQANKLEKRSNNEPISEIFNVDDAVCLSRVRSMRVNSETKAPNIQYKSRQSAFVNYFFLCAFITAVVAVACYLRMRNAWVYSLS